jgi:hypothetical protein
LVGGDDGVARESALDSTLEGVLVVHVHKILLAEYRQMMTLCEGKLQRRGKDKRSVSGGSKYVDKVSCARQPLVDSFFYLPLAVLSFVG